MKLGTKACMASVLTIVIGGMAVATPIVKLATPIFSTGTISGGTLAHGIAAVPDADDPYFNVRLVTNGPSTVTIQDGAYAAPGGQNGWHSHPGIVIVTMISGSIEWFDGNCNRKVYNAGDSWTEGSHMHAFRVLGNTAVHLSAVFLIAKDQAYRIDKAAPACATELGL
jgi:quercetin dioxygenase-like cupin family protein